MKPNVQVFAAFSVLVALTFVSRIPRAKTPDRKPSAAPGPNIERGRYLVRVSACNDCHTPMFGPRGGDVPEKDWLIGVPVGWTGPWGTTYAANLRKRAASMTEEQWVSYLKNLKTRPPMPFYAVNDLNENDSRSMYRFIRSLGDHPQEVPVGLAPGETPKTPYFNFDLIMPKTTAR